MAMEKVYQRINWENLPSEKTPLDEINLNKMDKAIDDLDDRIIGLSADSKESNEYNYSTDPQIVGWWIDGRPIYEKLFVVNDEKNSSFDIPSGDTNYKYFLSASGNAYSNEKQKKVNIPYNSVSQSIQVSANDEEKNISVEIDSTGYKNFYISVRYGGKIILKNYASWSTGSDQEISNMLQAHYDGDIDIRDYWNVGDTRKVVISSMPASDAVESHAEQEIELVITHKGGYDLVDYNEQCAFVVAQKDVLTNPNTGNAELGLMINSARYNASGGWPYWTGSNRYLWLDNMYLNAFPDTIKKIFKKFKYVGNGRYMTGRGGSPIVGTFTLPSVSEIFGGTLEGFMWDYYKDGNNRIKNAYKSNTPVGYWTRTWYAESRYMFVGTNGSLGNYPGEYSIYGIAPFGVI